MARPENYGRPLSTNSPVFFPHMNSVNNKHDLQFRSRYHTVPSWTTYMPSTSTISVRNNDHFSSDINSSSSNRKRRGDSLRNDDKEHLVQDEPWVKKKKNISNQTGTTISRSTHYDKVGPFFLFFNSVTINIKVKLMRDFK